MDTDSISYTKMSELASTEIKDQQTINILICYLLYRINKPVDSEQLYDISVGTGIINYFFYHDSINYLLTDNLIKAETTDKNETLYTLT